MTHEAFIERIHDSGRSLQDLDREEIIEALQIVADDIMGGSVAMSEAQTLLAVRHSLMTKSEQVLEEAILAQAAHALGKQGGSRTSEAKARAARENGKRGGRPKN